VRRTISLVVLAAALGGCAAVVNYTDPAGPRYAAVAPSRPDAPDTLSVVAFNVELGRRVDEVVRLLRASGPLHHPDVLLLQEMDETGTRAIADSLGYGYVYYPATLSPATRRDFGNAVLSRFPIVEDEKVVLPHLGRFRHSLRAAVGATIVVGSRRLRVYSIHFGTLLNTGPGARRDQLATVLADADRYPVVLMGGDFNSGSVAELALGRGYEWPTRHFPHTDFIWTLDHMLLKGLSLAAPQAIGLVRDIHGASDHKPIWALVVLPGEGVAGSR
jgi:endonuclease/exonuclease/phosphatase family metal-dependent hydrolase